MLVTKVCIQPARSALSDSFMYSDAALILFADKTKQASKSWKVIVPTWTLLRAQVHQTIALGHRRTVKATK